MHVGKLRWDFFSSNRKNSKELLIPFWNRQGDDDGNFWRRPHVSKFLFYLKVILYTFSGIMILCSFIQSFAAPWTNYNPNPGVGLEFGYAHSDFVNDEKFDLGSRALAAPKYAAFYKPHMVFGPFLSLLVYPLARVFTDLMWAFQKNDFLKTTSLNVILAMLVIMFFMRFIAFWMNLRTAIYQEKQFAHQSSIDAINNKYDRADPSDKQAKMRKHQEIMKYNRRHNLKPLVALENFFVSTPIFLIVFKLITICRPIKFAVLFGVWDLSKTPSSMIFYNLLSDGWKYLLLCLVIIPTNFLSQKISVWLSHERNPSLKRAKVDKNSQAYKMQRVQKFMSMAFLLFTFFWSTSLAIYYFLNSIFTIAQSLIIHRILLYRREKTNMAQHKLQKLGLDV